MLGLSVATVAGLSGAAAVLAAPGSAQAPSAAGSARPGGVAQSATATSAAKAQVSAPTADAHPGPVILIGISGLRWSDISQTQTPALWRLAERSSVGSLVVSAVRTLTCPTDAWLTLNSGARATATSRPEPCRLPAVLASPTPGPSGRAQVPALDTARTPNIESVNTPYSYDPCWGVLGSTNAPGAGCPPKPQVPHPGCATAIGPGAALALAGPTGVVQNYAADLGGTPRSLLVKCPLTVLDLGALPAPGASGNARAKALRMADQEAGRVIAAAPAGATIVVAGVGDDVAAHVHAIIIGGPGFGPGLLKAASTRQPGMVAITDLTPTILHWLGRGYGNLVGSVIHNSSRGTLASVIRMLAAQDTAAQVYQATLGWFFVIYAAAEGLAIGLIALTLRGDEPGRRQRRVAGYRIAGVCGASVPAGTFLANLVPWAQLPHPALLLYGLALAWTALIAIVALTGPWRRDPLGSAGFVGAVTAAVLAIDVITGSHLQLSVPFGLPVLVAGRWYGIGNNALGPYAAGGLICAAWAGAAALRAGNRTRAVAAAGAVAVVLLLACATPAWGAKVGGTIALAPAFLLLLAGIAGVRITPLRAGLIAVSGLVLITAFAALSYVYPAVGISDISAFVGHVVHGGAGAILNRKASANLHSLTETWFTPVVPLIVALFGLMIVWPERLRLRVLARAFAVQPLLRPLFIAIWTAGVLGWLADDSGVSVAAAMLPVALPLAIVMVTLTAECGRARAAGGLGAADWASREGPVRAPGSRG
jgi:hypothetical protein